MPEIGQSHIASRFDIMLREMDQNLERLGLLAADQTLASVQALAQCDIVLADRVIAAEAEADDLQNEINAQVYRLLALRSPLADDLRVVISGMTVATELERVADHAASTAHRVRLSQDVSRLPAVNSVVLLGQLVANLLQKGVSAYVNRDATAAYLVWGQDKAVDEAYAALVRELLTYMMEDPRTIAACSHLLFIAKNLERVGDHATNIAEKTWFIVKGQAISGARPKADDSTSAMV